MSEHPEFSGPFRTVLDFVEGRNYVHTAHHAEQRVTLSLTGNHAEYRYQLRVSHGGEFLQITVHYPFRIRSEKFRASVAELVARANYAMLLGKFELDLSDGEIRYHLSHLIEGDLSVETVERLFFTALLTMERYFPAVMQHLHAGYTPEDSVYLAELDYHSDKIPDQGKSSARIKSTVMVPRKRPAAAPKEPAEEEEPVSREAEPASGEADAATEKAMGTGSRKRKSSRKKQGKNRELDPAQKEFPF